MTGFRIAVVGAGPAGAYTAEALLKADIAVPIAVDVIDRLPTPWGLVRSGVAPDHPQIKTVTRVFERIADRPGFRFIGGVRVGHDLTHDDLLAAYDAVVYTLGAEESRRLGVEGEDLPGVLPALDLVRWYNGHPDASSSPLPRHARRAVVIGNGNVALDCARMLIQNVQRLVGTDAAPDAVAELAECRINEVVVLGRRGPADASFSMVELKELGELDDVEIVVEPGLGTDPDPGTDESPTRQMLLEYAHREPTGRNRRLVFRFGASPVAVNGDTYVTSVDIARRYHVDGEWTTAADRERIECDLLIPAVGFGVAGHEGLPLSDQGIVAHDSGRVGPRVYVAGWAKRGPSGVIGTNRKDAIETADAVLEDIRHGTLAPMGGAGIDAVLESRSIRVVDLRGWRAIDQAELAAGAAKGRVRMKLTTLERLHAAALGATPATQPHDSTSPADRNEVQNARA